jgi:hypothetical protein
MSINDASRIVIDDSRVVLQIVASHTDDSRGVTYDPHMFIVQNSGLAFTELLTNNIFARVVPYYNQG